jgi:hypothetical protein
VTGYNSSVFTEHYLASAYAGSRDFNEHRSVELRVQIIPSFRPSRKQFSLGSGKWIQAGINAPLDASYVGFSG